jgi:two-component system, cell cycle sensor histidine kinase and response regulator CckA
MLQNESSNAALKEKKQNIAGTILIVDDQEMVRTMVADLLGGMNYTVLTAKDGLDAVELLKEMKQNAESDKHPVDLILLDMILPKIDGKETYRRIREIDSHVKVILSTGYDVNNKVNEMLSDGAVGFIQKPYHIDKLVGIVRKHISRN